MSLAFAWPILRSNDLQVWTNPGLGQGYPTSETLVVNHLSSSSLGDCYFPISCDYLSGNDLELFGLI